MLIRNVNMIILMEFTVNFFNFQTGRSRGFAFVYYSSKEDARAAKDRCSGMDIDGRRIRVDYSITQRAHTPTPGIYMGRPT
jgi:transformer-2 protein